MTAENRRLHELKLPLFFRKASDLRGPCDSVLAKFGCRATLLGLSGQQHKQILLQVAGCYSGDEKCTKQELRTHLRREPGGSPLLSLPLPLLLIPSEVVEALPQAVVPAASAESCSSSCCSSSSSAADSAEAGAAALSPLWQEPDAVNFCTGICILSKKGRRRLVLQPTKGHRIWEES